MTRKLKRAKTPETKKKKREGEVRGTQQKNTESEDPFNRSEREWEGRGKKTKERERETGKRKGAEPLLRAECAPLPRTKENPWSVERVRENGVDLLACHLSNVHLPSSEFTIDRHS